MRISELFEGQMLLESYKDYKRVYREIVDGSSDFAADRLKNEVRVLSGHGVTVDNFPDFLEKILRNQRYIALLKSPNMSGELSNFILNNLNRNLGIRSPTDVSSWLRSLNSRKDADDGFWGTLDHYHAVATLIELVEKEIAKRTPDYTTVAKTSSYIIFDVKNFAAAKKLRDQLGATCTWCIGANEGHFKYYGEDQGMKTYIVYLLKTKKGMVIHVNNANDHLITAHSNQSEAKIRNGVLVYTRGGDGREIEKDLRASMSPEEMVAMFSSVKLRFNGKPVINNDVRVMDKFLNKLKSDKYASETRIARNIINNYNNVYQNETSQIIRFLYVNLLDLYDDHLNASFSHTELTSGVALINIIRNNLAVIHHILKHIDDLVYVGVLPRGVEPTVRLPYLIHELFIDIERGKWDADIVNRLKTVSRKLDRFTHELASSTA